MNGRAIRARLRELALQRRLGRVPAAPPPEPRRAAEAPAVDPPKPEAAETR